MPEVGLCSRTADETLAALTRNPKTQLAEIKKMLSLLHTRSQAKLVGCGRGQGGAGNLLTKPFPPSKQCSTLLHGSAGRDKRETYEQPSPRAKRMYIVMVRPSASV